MPRTDEQKAADEALTAAIERVRAAYLNGAPAGEVLTDYAVVQAWQGWDSDGDPYTITALHPRDGDGVPGYRIIGLLREQTAILEHVCCTED